MEHIDMEHIDEEKLIDNYFPKENSEPFKEAISLIIRKSYEIGRKEEALEQAHQRGEYEKARSIENELEEIDDELN